MSSAEKPEAPVAEIDPVVAKLKELGVPDDAIGKIQADLGVSTVEDLAGITEEDLVSVGMKKIPARRVVTVLKSAAPSASVAGMAAGAVGAASFSFDGILPSVLTESSWIEALRAGGVLKVDQSTVIAAVRAALAHRVGLFNIPEKLASLMEQFAEENDEQVDPEFFKLRKQLTRRNYSEIFEAIEGFEGTFVTETRKKQLFARLDKFLWPSFTEFYSQLKNWQEAWVQGSTNPALMMGAMMGMMSGGGVAGALPPGMMSPPDTGILRDHADAVNDAANKVFAGMGVQIASAVGYDATKIKESLENPRLPMMIGVANRDQMLRKLGAAVSATYPRLETNLTRFVLAVLRVKDVPAGNEELQYFGALFMLGSQIPWDQLGGEGSSVKPTGIGGRRGDI